MGLDDNWLLEDTLALFFYVVFPIFILSGVVNLVRTRKKPPDWRPRVWLTPAGSVSRGSYRVLSVILIVQGVLGMILFSFLASIFRGLIIAKFFDAER